MLEPGEGGLVAFVGVFSEVLVDPGDGGGTGFADSSDFLVGELAVPEKLGDAPAIGKLLDLGKGKKIANEVFDLFFGFQAGEGLNEAFIVFVGIVFHRRIV